MAISQAFIDAATNNAPNVTRVLVGEWSDTDGFTASYTFGPDELQSVEIIRAVNEGTFSVGGTDSATLTAVVLTSAMPTNLEFMDIAVDFGYQTGTDEATGEAIYEYERMGLFATNDSLIIDGGLWTTITAYDLLYWMNYNVTGKLPAVGTAVGTHTMMSTLLPTVPVDMTNLPDVQLKTYRPGGTQREVLGQIAAAGLTNAYVTPENKVAFTNIASGNTYAVEVGDTVADSVSVSSDHVKYAIDHVGASLTKSYDIIPKKDDTGDADYEAPEDETTDYVFPAGANGIGVTFDEGSFNGGTLLATADLNTSSTPKYDTTVYDQAVADLEAISANIASIAGKYNGFTVSLFGMSHIKPMDIITLTDTVTHPNGDPDYSGYRFVVLSCDYVSTGSIKTTIAAEPLSDDDSEVATSNQTSANTAAMLQAATSQLTALNNLTVKTLRGNNATFNKVVTDSIMANELNAVHASIDSLEADKAAVTDLNAANAKITSLQAGKADIDLANVKDASVTNAMIANGAITNAKIGTAAIETANIADGAIVNAKIGSAAVGTANIQQAAITNELVQDAAINDAKILGVSANKLTAGTIDASKINVSNLNASNITAGKLTVGGVELDVANAVAKVDGGTVSSGTLPKSALSQEIVDEIDGAIETWTADHVPTSTTYPESQWASDTVKSQHVGDVCYVVNSALAQDGYCYRYSKSETGEYSWNLIKDSDVTAALRRLTTAEGAIDGYGQSISKLQTDTGMLTTRTTELQTSVSNAQFTAEEAKGAAAANAGSISTINDTLKTTVTKTELKEVTDTVDKQGTTLTKYGELFEQVQRDIGDGSYRIYVQPKQTLDGAELTATVCHDQAAMTEEEIAKVGIVRWYLTALDGTVTTSEGLTAGAATGTSWSCRLEA